MILNQTRTGKSCPRDIAHLHAAVPEGSLMRYVRVHAWNLAVVLDRLEALEKFQAEVLASARYFTLHKSVD